MAVMGFSGDGDPRILKAMEQNTKLGLNKSSSLGDFFAVEENYDTFYVQDTVHIITKLRNRLFRPNSKMARELPVGNYVVTIEHLRSLMKILPKDVHLLHELDLDGNDRMNYNGAERICTSKVQVLITEHVTESEGTQLYLKIMDLVKDSFLNDHLHPQQRLFNIWLATFILRIWRQWIIESEIYNLREHFISRNNYVCIELNAHALTLMLLNQNLKFQESNMVSPSLMSSQACEQFFRNLRSMTTTHSTVVNFSMLELLYRIKRIDLHEILNLKLTEEGINLPRYRKRLATVEKGFPLELPREEIIDIIERARNDAINKMNGMGIHLSKTSTTFKSQSTEMNLKTNLNCSDRQNEMTQDFDGCEILEPEGSIETDILRDLESSSDNEDEMYLLEGPVSLKKFGKLNSNESLDPKSLYVAVRTTGGSAPIIIKKSSLVWRLSRSGGRVSTDRLTRFQNK